LSELEKFDGHTAFARDASHTLFFFFCFHLFHPPPLPPSTLFFFSLTAIVARTRKTPVHVRRFGDSAFQCALSSSRFSFSAAVWTCDCSNRKQLPAIRACGLNSVQLDWGYGQDQTAPAVHLWNISYRRSSFDNRGAGASSASRYASSEMAPTGQPSPRLFWSIFSRDPSSVYGLWAVFVWARGFATYLEPRARIYSASCLSSGT